MTAAKKLYAIWFESPRGDASHWVEGEGGSRWEGSWKEANFIVRECVRVVKRGEYSVVTVEGASGSN